ncbi:MAG TPA: DUF1015 domain-containing protein [Terriglobales bacterium]|nr:DUF1015 domain-containing protein [Terriglobales bacterium]
MAHIQPFAAWRFNPAKVRLEDVLTQPYDKITPEMQKAYYEASPFNLVRLELGKKDPADSDTSNVYIRAAEFLESSRKEGALVQDIGPSIYAYSQTFTPPGKKGPAMTRRGFIALARLHDYADAVVFRHEQTLSKPKADRLNLLRSTKVHSGQIFMLYSDPEREVEALIWKAAGKAAPAAEMTDEYGVIHRLWRISDPATILAVRDKMVDKKLLIADGHHRYETALTYRNECRAEEGMDMADFGRTGQMAVKVRSPYENLMMTMINMEDAGLLILPTHRLVHGLASFQPQTMLKDARRYFDVSPLEKEVTAAQVMERLETSGRVGQVLAAHTAEGTFLLTAKKSEIEARLQDISAEQRALDVMVLHKVLLEDVMGISEEAIRDQTHLEYIRDAAEAMKKVTSGANVAFLMNPVKIEQMRDVSFSGQVMPQKSTDFYPKLMSGLTLYDVGR